MNEDGLQNDINKIVLVPIKNCQDFQALLLDIEEDEMKKTNPMSPPHRQGNLSGETLSRK